MIDMIKAYRIGRKYYKKHGNNKLLKVWMRFFNLVYGCHISAECEIGEGTQLGYNGLGVVIHDKCKIGKNCMISQNVTLGGKADIPGQKERKVHFYKDGSLVEVPILGNNIKVGAGSCILGGVIIGDNSIIGANAVVVDDIPANSVAGGVPGRVLRTIVST